MGRGQVLRQPRRGHPRRLRGLVRRRERRDVLRQQQDAAGNPLTNPDGSPIDDSRWGDYVHVRLAHPDTRFFSAFGYAVRDDTTKAPSERMDFLYVEFGRETLPTPGLR